MVLEIDDRLLEAIDKAHRLRPRDEGHRLESAALPTKREVVNGDGASRLTPREIQQRLRAGESVTALARSSGTDEAWIRRFAAPVLAEQAKVVERARTITFAKRGVGPSGATLGPAVAANVIDRGVPLTLPDLEAGWRAYQHPEGGWHVTFTFPLRGRRQTAEWELDLAAGELTARNRLASELAWREPGKRLPQPKPVKAPAAKRATGSRGESGAARSAGAVPEAASTAGAEPESGAPAPVATENAAPEKAASEKAVAAEAVTSDSGDGREGAESVQVLPLDEEATALPPGGLVREAPPPAGKAPARKAPASKAPASKAPASKAPASKAPASKAPASKPAPPAKRTAAAMTEAPAQSVVPVPPVQAGAEPAARPAGSMPPTDLDVVDVTGEFSPLDDGDDSPPDRVVVIPPSLDDDVVLADEPKAPVAGEPEPEEHDAPTGPISLAARPQPAPLGAPPAPRGGPPAP